jgi:hypothetical protein
MTDAEQGMRLDAIARLSQMSNDEFLERVVKLPLASSFLASEVNRRNRMRWDYSDALAVETARQFHDDSGLPFVEAARLISYTRAFPAYFEAVSAPNVPSKTTSDFWIAVSASRNTWGSSPRGSWPLTGFGSGEYWAQMHFNGTLDDVMHEIKKWMLMDEALHPDSDPARIFLCNVSAADRRLRRRAADLGIDVDIAAVTAAAVENMGEIDKRKSGAA